MTGNPYKDWEPDGRCWQEGYEAGRDAERAETARLREWLLEANLKVAALHSDLEAARAELARTGTLNQFHRVNRDRQHEAFAPAHSLMALVVCVQEEAGELAAAVLGVTGEKKRKAHLTNADVLDAVADAMTYLSLVASNVGCDDLEKLLGDTFNMVSVRAGSALRTTLGQSLTTPPAPVSPCPTQSPGADVDDWKTSTDESEET